MMRTQFCECGHTYGQHVNHDYHNCSHPCGADDCGCIAYKERSNEDGSNSNIAERALLAAFLLFMLGAVTTAAQNFRAADQIYLQLIGNVNTSAVGSTVYGTELFIMNPSPSDSVAVSCVYSPVNASPATLTRVRNWITLSPRESRSVTWIQDGLGMLILNGCLAGADCSGNDNANPNYRSISIEAVIRSSTYLLTGARGTLPPTRGESWPDTPWYNYISANAGNGKDHAQIVGLRNSPQYRTNLGVANASEYSACDVVVTLFDGLNRQRGQALIHLEPLTNLFPLDVATLFPALVNQNRDNRTPPITSAWVDIKQVNIDPTPDAAAHNCPDGCPAILAFGSLIDKQTGDAMLLESQYDSPPATAPQQATLATKVAIAQISMVALRRSFPANGLYPEDCTRIASCLQWAFATHPTCGDGCLTRPEVASAWRSTRQTPAIPEMR